MTQEELLQKLADIAHNKDAHEARNDYLLALRAVVELHWHNEVKSSTGEVLETYCLECPNLSSYPCLTIQAIEKALV